MRSFQKRGGSFPLQVNLRAHRNVLQPPLSTSISQRPPNQFSTHQPYQSLSISRSGWSSSDSVQGQQWREVFPFPSSFTTPKALWITASGRKPRDQERSSFLEGCWLSLLLRRSGLQCKSSVLAGGQGSNPCVCVFVQITGLRVTRLHTASPGYKSRKEDQVKQ